MEASARAENPLYNLAFNILIPVIILNQFSSKAPLLTLAIALAFPLGYGLWDYIVGGKKNWISVLGFLNTLMTGGLALLETEGIWFAVKEGAFPLVIGLLVLGTAFSKRTAVHLLFFHEAVLDLPRLSRAIDERGQQKALRLHLQRSTILLSFSFFLSAVLNFLIAVQTFTQIDPTLSVAARQTLLNEQIGAMTWKGYVFIALPLMLVMFGVLYYLISGLQKLSGMKLEELIPKLQTDEASPESRV